MGREREPKPAKKPPVKEPTAADKLTQAPSVDQGVGDSMNRKRVVDNGPTGDPYVDHGAVCEANDGRQCFLSAAQRGRLIQNLQLRVMEASENFKHAVAALRLDELLKKDEDLPWVVTLMLDLVTGHVASKLTAALVALRQGALDRVVREAGSLDTVTGWRAQGARALEAITDDHLKTGVKQAIDTTKKDASASLKRRKNRPAQNRKSETLSYLDRLLNEATLGFAKIREGIPATANDAEIVTLYHSFETAQHLVPLYKDALAAKIERYRASGINNIGWLPPSSDESPSWFAYDEDGRPLRAENGVFVVWQRYASGRPKRLVYQWDGRPGFTPGQGHLGGKNLPDGTPGRDDRNMRGRFFVPEEFVEIAIERHRHVWGADPGSESIDDHGHLPSPSPRATGTQQGGNR